MGKLCACQKPVQEVVVRRSGPKKEQTGARWMLRVREALAVKPDDLGLIPRAHEVEGDCRWVSNFQTHQGVHVPPTK